MTEPRLTPDEAIGFALTLGDAGGLAPPRLAKLVLDAVRLAGYRIVPLDGEAPASSAVPKVAAAARDEKPAPKLPEKWPQLCPKCPKAINSRAHAEEACDKTDCPF